MDTTKLIEKFRINMEKYKKLGLNPFSLATGCAVKVDLIDTVYPALQKIREELRKINIEISPREDVDYFVSRDEMKIKRIINGGEFDADRAISLIQVNQRTANNPEYFSKFLLKVYSSIKTRRKLTIGKGHSIVTSNPFAEVAIIDLVQLNGKEQNSYTVMNNDTIQIVDPMEDPGSQMQVDVAVSNALNDLFTKGAIQDLAMLPVADAPSEELKEKLLQGFRNFAEKYNVNLVNEIQPNTNSLMIGATVIGKSDHELPMFYNRVTEGMEILVSRPVGELTPINVNMWVLSVTELLDMMENNYGIRYNELEEIKRRALRYMQTPNIAVGKIIYNHLPEFGKPFDEKEHIAMTTDVTGPGIFVVKEFAEKANVDVKLDQIPVIDRRLCEFATENFIIPNSTAGTNGAIVIFAHKKVVDQVYEELKKEGQEPMIIGKVLGRGNGTVYVPKDTVKLIERENVLKQFKLLEE
ncbi:MAG: SelD-related putative sulfur metabolism protein [Sulfolobaceae archaeon]|nr:SelD-related putative sulfur metabolism protein [Sulfolobaceae archaeon]